MPEHQRGEQNVQQQNCGLNRSEVEDFLYLEADHLDQWALDEWLGLWSESSELSYQVAPTGEDDPGSLESSSTMFLISDNRYRLEQRIVRMKKNSFHAEYVRSRTRHMYGHVRIIHQDARQAEVQFNASVYRSKGSETVIYPSLVRATLARTPGGLRLVKKRVELDLYRLATMGALTILL